jgi:hypothetical protein
MALASLIIELRKAQRSLVAFLRSSIRHHCLAAINIWLLGSPADRPAFTLEFLARATSTNFKV